MRVLVNLALFSLSVLLLVGCAQKLQNPDEGGSLVDVAEEGVYNFEEGRHYVLLPEPIPNMATVTEFFYFGCRSCYQLIPAVSQWRADSGHEVALVPVHTERRLVDAARMFHTFVEMGVLAKMYELGFVIYQSEDSKLYGKSRINDFLIRHKVDVKRFWETWGSERVNRRLQTSLQLTRLAQVIETPAFLVEGRYRVNTESVSSLDELFALFDFLVEKEKRS